MNGRLVNPGSWEVQFIEAAVELTRKGWDEAGLMELLWDVIDAELVFSDGKEPA